MWLQLPAAAFSCRAEATQPHAGLGICGTEAAAKDIQYAVLALLAANLLLGARPPLLTGSRREDRAGWIYVRLQGTPSQIGYQHGYWLAPEIDQLIRVAKLEEQHNSGSAWQFYYAQHRRDAMRLFWPKVPSEYRRELIGIVRGVRSRGFGYGIGDIVYNAASEEQPYYYDWLRSMRKKGAKGGGEHCSAFVATGSATWDGKIVMGHNCWSDYLSGEHNNIILDISPKRGHHILMDSFPGHIDSGDDFGINSSGIMLTETTISDFVGFDPKGVPEFVRMREAMQYSSSLSDVERWFVEGNNGGYANTWLIGDRKTNEIGQLELGLKNVIFSRTNDGFYTGCNCPLDPKLTAEECTKDPKKGSTNCSDRVLRWSQLMARDKGKIDAESGKRYLGDHVDVRRNKVEASFSSLCGHGETEARADHTDHGAFVPDGAVQGKVVTSDLAGHMSFWARMGHPCGEPFLVGPFLKAHPKYAWQKPLLGDMPTQPWVKFTAK